jgi:CRP/FNR family transcriptional regulator, cyclic AMP receptor protein
MSELFARFGKHFTTGEVLFREGEPGDVMYVLHTGAVKITKRVADEEKAIAVLGPGEFFGEMAILNDKPRTASATVVEDAECLVIDGRRLEAMVANSTEIALRLIKKLAKRLDSADALIEILMHKDPKARVMLGLSRHADAFGEPTEEGIRLRIRAEDLAKAVAVELPLVEAVLDRLKKMRLASEGEDGELIVADVDRLQDFLEFLEMPQKFGREAGGMA